MDETLSVGDVFFQEKCEKRIQHFIDDGHVTVLFVSHAMDQVERICQRAVWIEKGDLRMDGPVDEVCKAYRAQFAQAPRNSGWIYITVRFGDSFPPFLAQHKRQSQENTRSQQNIPSHTGRAASKPSPKRTLSFSGRRRSLSACIFSCDLDGSLHTSAFEQRTGHRVGEPESLQLDIHLNLRHVCKLGEGHAVDVGIDRLLKARPEFHG